MELVLVSHRSCAALQVRDIGIVVANDESPLELTCTASIDAEVRAEFHRTAHAFWDIDERAVAEDCGVECCEEIVFVGNDAAQVLAHQVGVLADSLADGAEDDAFLLEFLAESCLDAHRIHHRIDGCSGQSHTFFQRNAQLVEGLHKLWVNCPSFGGVGGGRSCIVGDGLIVNLRHL